MKPRSGSLSVRRALSRSGVLTTLSHRLSRLFREGRSPASGALLPSDALIAVPVAVRAQSGTLKMRRRFMTVPGPVSSVGGDSARDGVGGGRDPMGRLGPQGSVTTAKAVALASGHPLTAPGERATRRDLRIARSAPTRMHTPFGSAAGQECYGLPAARPERGWVKSSAPVRGRAQKLADLVPRPATETGSAPPLHFPACAGGLLSRPWWREL
jgi:hypothetical protein